MEGFDVKELELVPDPAILITGLRDTGYDFNTSLSDIVDNSVDANAKKIEIRMDLVMAVRGGAKPLITIADDGCGMTKTELINGMRYGAQDTEKKNPKRLGKFGLGLKTASTAICTKLSVISKAHAEDKLVMATWDLEQVCKNNKWNLEITEEENIPKEYMKRTKMFAENGHGTLVVWDNIDRLVGIGKSVTKKTLDDFADKYGKYAEKVYGRFLDENDSRAPNIQITVNNKLLKSFDPFCKREIRGDEDSDGTVLFTKQKVPVEIIRDDGTIGKAEFELKGYVLPHKDDFSSEESKKEACVTNKNMGFWVYRENRLIADGDWLGIWMQEPHSNLCRIEFSFTYELDAAFKIDVKKSRIILNPDLMEYLETWARPVKSFAEERYRGKLKQSVIKSNEVPHKDADNDIQRKEKELSMAEITVDETAKKKEGTAVVNVVNSSNYGGQPLRIRIAVPDKDDKGVTVIPKDSLPDGVLWSPTIHNNHHAVMINKSHEFYQKVYFPNRNDRNVITALDFMFWALSETEWGVKTTGSNEQFIEFKYNVSKILRSLMEKLDDPEV